MTYRALDSKGDYCFGRGSSEFLAGIEAVRQAIQTKLNLLQGEWWEAPSEGLPLFQEILGDPESLKELSMTDLLIKSRILDVKDVTGFASFKSEYNPSARHYTAHAVVNTIYGEVEVNLG